MFTIGGSGALMLALPEPLGHLADLELLKAEEVRELGI